MTLNRDLIGKEYAEVPFEVDRDRIVQFADAIGDDDLRYRGQDPIAPPTFPTVMQIATGGQVVLHQDDDFARSVGFPGIIAHGMFTMGHLAACITKWAGDPEALKRIKVQFRA